MWTRCNRYIVNTDSQTIAELCSFFLLLDIVLLLLQLSILAGSYALVTLSFSSYRVYNLNRILYLSSASTTYETGLYRFSNNNTKYSVNQKCRLNNVFYPLPMDSNHANLASKDGMYDLIDLAEERTAKTKHVCSKLLKAFCFVRHVSLISIKLIPLSTLSICGRMLFRPTIFI